MGSRKSKLHQSSGYIPFKFSSYVLDNQTIHQILQYVFYGRSNTMRNDILCLQNVDPSYDLSTQIKNRTALTNQSVYIIPMNEEQKSKHPHMIISKHPIYSSHIFDGMIIANLLINKTVLPIYNIYETNQPITTRLYTIKQQIKANIKQLCKERNQFKFRLSPVSLIMSSVLLNSNFRISGSTCWNTEQLLGSNTNHSYLLCSIRTMAKIDLEHISNTCMIGFIDTKKSSELQMVIKT